MAGTDLYKLTGEKKTAQAAAKAAALSQADKLATAQANLSGNSAMPQWAGQLASGAGSLAQKADAQGLSGLNAGSFVVGVGNNQQTADAGVTGQSADGTKTPKQYLDEVIAGKDQVLGQWDAQYPNGYPMSGAVQEAQEVLNGILSSRPAGYTSQYEQQIMSLYDQIMNRPKFSYDVNKDPLFQQYKNQYMVNGQRAMQDTLGQAAALAGGYGSSWGTTAGYQAYQQYIQALNDRIPELEQRAFDRYSYEGDQMRQNMDLTMNLDNRDYSRYRDTVEDWKDDRSFEYGRYRDAVQDWQTDRAFDYGQYRDSVSDYYNDRNFGWTMYDAEAQRDLTNYWNQKNYDLEVQKFLASQAEKSGSGGGGGGGGSSGSSSSGKTTTSAKTTKTTENTSQSTKNIWEGLNNKTKTTTYYSDDEEKRKRLNKAV